MFSSVFLKTFRDCRAAMLGWGLGLAVLMLVGASQYSQVVTGTGAARAHSAAEATKALKAFGFLIGEVTSIDTIGGFITTRVLSYLPVFLALWAVITGAGLTRGEEQQGTLDVLLSTPQSRIRVLGQKMSALLLAVVIATALSGLGLAAGIAIDGDSVPVDGLVLVVVNVLGIVAFWGAVAILVAQLVISRRATSGITSGVLFASFLLNNTLESLPSLQGLAWLSPFHYYSLSKPLVPGRGFEQPAWLALVGLSIVLAVLAYLCFAVRDIGATYPLFRGRYSRTGSRPSTFSGILLKSVFSKAIRDLTGPSLAWGVGIGLYGVVIVSTTTEALGPIRELARNGGGILSKFIGDLASNEAYLSIGLLTYLPALLAVFAITQVDSWAVDEEEGRLELLAAMPLPRWQLLAARYAASGLALIVIISIVCVFLFMASASANVSLNGGRVIEALVATLPTTLVVLAFGLCVATMLQRPSRATSITVAVVVFMFFLDTFGRLFDFPGWLQDLSIFHLYGRPLVEGTNWSALSALTGVTILLAFLSLLNLSRRDIAK